MNPTGLPRSEEATAEQGHTKWTDAEKVEIDQINDYNTLKDMGKDVKMPKDYQKICVQFVYDAKESGQFKARLMAGGHLTDPTLEDSYSGVVSIKSLCIAMIVGIANGLEIQCGDIGNAYLELYTKEKVYFIAGPEFGELEGHIVVIVKALYGL